LLLNPVLWITLAACALAATPSGLDSRMAAIAGLAVAVKCASDALLSRRLRGAPPRLGEVLLIPVKDLVMAAIWLVGAFRRTVDWRGNKLWIHRGSELTEVAPPAFEEAAQEIA
jgi:ceramide glucosyltransferase